MHRTFATFLISLYLSLQCSNCCPPNGYIFCANQTGTCVGNGMVAYGNNDVYSYQSSSTSINCRNAPFGGSPISGTKKCCIQSPALSGPATITNIVNSISCGETVNGYLQDLSDIHYYKLTTLISNDTTYNLCDTGFDSSLTVYNSVGTKISDPYCAPGMFGYGDDCGNCVDDRTEIFTITNQAAGTYYIRIQYFDTLLSTVGTHLYTFTVTCPPSHIISDHFTSWTQISTPSMTTIGDKTSLMTAYDMNTNRIWLVGGDLYEKWYYDIDANAFISRGSLSMVMDNLNSQSSTQMFDSIYFANNNYLRSFNMTLESKSTFFSPLDVGNINAPCLTNDGRYIFVIGGENELSSSADDDAVNTFQIYDTLTDGWYVANAMNQKRHQFSCNISPDKKYLYVFGGRYYDSGTTITQTAEKIDISSMTNVLSLSVYWDVIETFSMKSNMYFSRSIVDEINGLIYTIGGRDTNALGDDRIQIIDPRHDLSILSAYTLNYGRSSPCVVMVNQIIYVFGGFTGSGSTNEMDTFEISNKLIVPTAHPTKYPSKYPSNIPTTTPTYNPTTYSTTLVPTYYPSNLPTNNPITSSPTTTQPTNVPTYSPTMQPTTFEPSGSPISEGAASVKTTDMTSSTSMAGLNKQNDKDSGVIIGSIIGGFVLLCCIIILLVIIVCNQVKHNKLRIQSESVIVSASSPTESGKVIQQFTDYGETNMHMHLPQEGGLEMIDSDLPVVIGKVAVSPGLVDSDSDKNYPNIEEMLAVNENVLVEINSLDETCGTLK